MGTTQPPDQSSMLSYKIEALERIVGELRHQLQNYVLAREHDLQLKLIQDTVERIEKEVSAAKTELSTLNTKLGEQRESQDKLQIKVLWIIVAFILTILSGVAVAFFTHLLH
jgi:septal ring factor EnvC (AmiA/AmiB activator)